jgi:HEAT repeat protein
VAGQLDTEQGHALRAVLLTAFKMDDAEVRQRALESVAYFSPDTEVEAAIADAYAKGERDLTIAALFAMGCNRALRWFPILYEELRSPDPAIRYVAAGAIGEYADERAVDRLVPLVEDEDRQVQGRAVSALGDIGGDAAVAVLERIAASDDLWLSQSAWLRLEQLRTRR